MWIHVNFFERDREYVRDEIKYILSEYSGAIDKYFFLFEDNPFCFLALEVKDTKIIPKIRKRYHVVSNTEDDLLGDGGINFINIMQEVCHWALHTDTRTKEKVLHCIANALQINKVNSTRLFKAMYIKSKLLSIQAKLVYKVNKIFVKTHFKWDI